jgi:pimeloyl-ACP methyl ester carboxylesterase
MKIRRISQSLCIVLLLLTCCTLSAQNEKGRVRNIVLVHGAWADGSGWKGVYDILVKDGYKVSIVQEPETSFQEDVAATKRILALQDGPCILVAHSYGGAVITEAGTDPSVAGLVSSSTLSMDTAVSCWMASRSKPSIAGTECSSISLVQAVITAIFLGVSS